MNKGSRVLGESFADIFSNGLIWFGAAVSVAEIEAGIQSGNNWLALITGHLLGGVLLFLVGLIGARLRLNAMNTTSTAFGVWGAKFFACLNLLQLVGWTAVMIAQGTSALGGLQKSLESPFTSAFLAIAIATWLFVGIKKSINVATVGMALLTILLVVLTYKLFSGSAVALRASMSGQVPSISFWSAFEISVAMPLSWLPLISDYTKDVRRPVVGTLTSALVYTLVSIWMYGLGIVIGMSGMNSIPCAILASGLGFAGVAIVAFSTIATTFLDAYSSGESAKTIYSKLNPKVVGAFTCAVGAALAISGIIDRYTDFLYLIASVFSPMASVLLVSHYFVKKIHVRWNLFSWGIGFMVYHVASQYSLEFIGPSLMAMLFSALLTLVGLCLKEHAT